MNTTASPPTQPVLTDVLAILHEVWDSFVGADEPLLPVPDRTGADWIGYAATITISGAWSGIVSLEFAADTAAAVSSRMLGLDQVTEEDVADAVGELVNMVGGNVKGLVPGPSVLSLPIVTTGRVARATDATEVCHADLAWFDQPLSMALHVIGAGSAS